LRVSLQLVDLTDDAIGLFSRCHCSWVASQIVESSLKYSRADIPAMARQDLMRRMLHLFPKGSVHKEARVLLRRHFKFRVTFPPSIDGHFAEIGGAV